MTHIQEKIEQYIDSRLSGKTGYLGYYDRTARRMKRRHLQNRAAAAIGAVLIPVVSNLPWAIPFWLDHHPGLHDGRLPHWAGGRPHSCARRGLSFQGAVAKLPGTEQYLLSQRFRFENRVDEYQTLTDEDAFKLFVSKVEKAIIDENNVTLNILGRSDAASAASSK